MRIVPSIKNLDPYRELPNSLRSTRLTFTSASPSNPQETQTTLASLLSSSSSSSHPSSSQPSLQTLTTKLSTSTPSLALSNPLKQSAQTQKKALALARRKRDALRGPQHVGLLSRKEIKRKGVWVPKKGELTWEGMSGLRGMWEEYMVELLALRSMKRVGGVGERWEGNAENLQAKIVKADFTGCVVRVTDAHNQDLIDLEGTVIHESENTFKIVTQSDNVKVIPKQHTTFTFSIPIPDQPSSHSSSTTAASHSPRQPSASTSKSASPIPSRFQSPAPNLSSKGSSGGRRRMQFELYGSQFLFRNSDRAGRKFKSKPGTEIWGGLG